MQFKRGDRVIIRDQTGSQITGTIVEHAPPEYLYIWLPGTATLDENLRRNHGAYNYAILSDHATLDSSRVDTYYRIPWHALEPVYPTPEQDDAAGDTTLAVPATLSDLAAHDPCAGPDPEQPEKPEPKPDPYFAGK